MRTGLWIALLLLPACRNKDDISDTGETCSWYQDLDGDGYGTDDETIGWCDDPPADAATQSGDCDDGNAGRNPGLTETPYDGLDNDCDDATLDDDLDQDGHGIADDCDDDEPTTHPDATEVCDGVDNDCDGEIDDALLGTFYADDDGDGYGDPAVSETDCDDAAGYVDNDGDCDDSDPAVNPDATEVCNGVDDDCDLLIDDDDPSIDDATTFYYDADADSFGDDATSIQACEAPADFVAEPGDCDDTEPAVNPDATEICNGVDDDCDSDVDDDDDSVEGQGTWWLDSDGDGVGSTAYSVDACELPDGFAADSDDCDDGDATAYPGANEACDDADNDCDGTIDENATDAGVWYEDSDGDGYGTPTSTVDSCDGGTAYVADNSDCDDANPAINPAATEECNGVDDDCDLLTDDDDPDVTGQSTSYADIDGDGYGDADSATTACDVPTDHVTDDTDCDDADVAVNPGAAETCNSVDDDCNGLVDSDDPGVVGESTWYLDYDGDGFGGTSFSVDDCTAPTGYVDNNLDCDDAHADANPSGTEICDGLDNDCNAATDDLGDGDGDGYDFCDDCNDSNASIHPGGTETCTGLDDDCDGLVDDEDPDVTGQTSWWFDNDGDGSAGDTLSQDACDQPDGFYETGDDCDDGDAAVFPGATETCNGTDDDCDGASDEGASDASTWYADTDGDGYGDATSALTDCDGGSTHVADGTDCDDGDSAVNPGASETCNGVDDDCDGLADDDDSSVTGQTTWYDDDDGDGYGDASASTTTCLSPTGVVGDDTDCDDSDAAVNPGAAEVCNGTDDDCNGDTDDDDAGVTDPTTWYLDADSDGHGGTFSQDSCEAASGFVADSDDCDDGDALISPSANEACNSTDDDCDGTVDEASSDAAVWYLDGDGDGYGDASNSLTNCDGGTSYVSDDTDCDDGDRAINPGEDEICNGIDDDCDGLTDDDDPSVADPLTFYTDDDGDGYGDPTTAQVTCDALTGLVTDDSDCDDSDSAVNPGATEICSGDDDDCDGDIDDADPDVTGTSTWFIDYDGDGFGSSSFTVDRCDALTGYVADATDCDDTDGDTWPGAGEYCDGHDDDCDGDTDESGALDVTTWYADADGDDFGDAAVALDDCEQPSGYLLDDTDCDDTSATSYPDARERADGADNDCDGAIDEELWLGTGDDGTLDVSTSFDLSDDASGTRTEPDGVAFAVTGLSGDTVTVADTPDGLAAGDEVLLINLHGSDGAHGSVGTYELQYVAGVSGNDVQLEDAVAGTYGETDNVDLSDQAILIQRVPNYTDVNVSAAGVLTASGWNGETGGIVALRANGTVTIESGGVITASELGYLAGDTGTCSNCDSFQGESYAGEGGGDVEAGSYNETLGYWAANYGGGGANVTGGGGNYGGGATPGDSWNGGGYTPPEAGEEYGDEDLVTLFHGSGGGGVWAGGEDQGPGGDGGGVVLLFAHTVDAQGAAAITCVGGTTYAWSQGTYTYGAGGGSGGSIWVIAEDLLLATDAIDATGGFGEDTHERLGGDGGDGRVRVDFNTLNANAEGSSAADGDLSAGSEPDPGSSGAP